MSEKPTIEQVRAEPAGRQMDAWVAEYVMGLPNVHMCEGYLIHTQDSIQWNGALVVDFYSTDIAAAWKVVEKLNNVQMPNHVGPTRVHRLSNCNNSWHIIFCSDFGYPPGEEVVENTAPLAICRASLLSVLEKQKDVSKTIRLDWLCGKRDDE